MDEKTKSEARKFALQNALEHGGKTRDKTVLSKILGSRPELRARAGQIMAEIGPIVEEINGMAPEAQRAEIEANFPEILQKKPEREEHDLPELEKAERGRVVTRFPPEPNGYPHIGHAKAAIINEEYVNRYGGRKILRMDDTNPENERMEYYAAIKVGLEWLGIKYDVIKNTSDDMDLLLEKGKEMLASGRAYVCKCKREKISKNRREMTACKCSREGVEKNIDGWEKMFKKFKPGEAIVRFRGDMDSKNTVMRDPVLFRIIDARHPLLLNKYRVWPSYDFAVAVEDSIDGITHAFRSKEYELRNELYGAILDGLGMRKPEVLEFSRLAFKGMPVSKRVLKPLIESGKIPSYDDPRLPTLEALKRRGIKREAIRRFILSLGFTKADTLAPFDALESFNRKIIDAESIRLFLVRNPRKISIDCLPASFVEMPNHPTVDMGKRRIEFDRELLVPSEDVQNIGAGDHIRLMGLGNIRIDGAGPEITGTYVNDDVGMDCPKMQWVPQKNMHQLRILIPKTLFIGETFNEESLEEALVATEPHYLQVREGGMIQFVRFGYCHKESQNMAIYAHR